MENTFRGDDMSFKPFDWIKLIVENYIKKKNEIQKKLDDTTFSLKAILLKIEQIDSEIRIVNETSCEYHREELEFKKRMTEELLTIKHGLQKELFDTLYVKQKRFVEQGYCSSSDKGEYEETYNVYHSMGRNGRADRYLENVLNLPEEKQENV